HRGYVGGPPARSGSGHLGPRGAAGPPPLWSLWTGYSSHRFGVLYPRRGHRGPRGLSPIQCHHPALPIGNQGSRRHRRHPDSLAPIAYTTSIRDTPRQKALLAAATGSNGDQLRVPLTKFEVRCATHLVHRRNVSPALSDRRDGRKRLWV